MLRVDEWTQVGSRGGLGGVADRLHRWLGRSIAPGLAGERRAVLEGIVLGDGAELSPGLRQDFQASGLYHILAVSGQNVVLVAAGALTLAWLLGLGRWVGELGALAGIGGYVLAVGPQPSVIRAGIAGGLASLAWLTGRLRDAWQALLARGDRTARLESVRDLRPGLPALVRRRRGDLHGRPADRPEARADATLPRGVRMGVAVSVGCTLVTAPIVWLQFEYLPLVGVPANALAEPAMPVLLGLAFVTAGLDSFAPGAASVVAGLNGWVAAYIAFCARTLGSLPFAEITSPRALAVVAGVLIGTVYLVARRGNATAW